jgi:hypothetical protein
MIVTLLNSSFPVPAPAYGLSQQSVLQCNQDLTDACVDLLQANNFGDYLEGGPNAQDQDLLFAVLMGFSQGIDHGASDMVASDFDSQVSSSV